MKLFDTFMKVLKRGSCDDIAMGNVAGIHECCYGLNHCGRYIASCGNKEYL